MRDESPPHTPLFYCNINRLNAVWICLTSFGHFPGLQCLTNTNNCTTNVQQALRCKEMVLLLRDESNVLSVLHYDKRLVWLTRSRHFGFPLSGECIVGRARAPHGLTFPHKFEKALVGGCLPLSLRHITLRFVVPLHFRVAIFTLYWHLEDQNVFFCPWQISLSTNIKRHLLKI